MVVLVMAKWLNFLLYRDTVLVRFLECMILKQLTLLHGHAAIKRITLLELCPYAICSELTTTECCL